MAPRRLLFLAACSGALLSHGPLLRAQTSAAAVRFHGTGTAQQDRIRIPVDDDAIGPDASEPTDVGAAGFTVEFWVRGLLADNDTAHAGGDVEMANEDWIYGNIIVDRDIWGGSQRDFGISLAGGFVRFGTGAGDSGPDSPNTIEGDVDVLDGQWHHVAVVRDAVTGIKEIHVDGALDFASAAGASTADLSYPDSGVPGQQTPWGPFLVLGAEKHDAGASFPSFDGFFDEFRVWDRVLSSAEIIASHDRMVPPDSTGLVGWYRFEEAAGTVVVDTSVAGSADGELIAGLPGNGEWVLWSDDPANTAPISQGALPPGFRRTTIVNGFDRSTALALPADGRIFVAELGGTIHVIQNDVLLGTPLIQLPVSASFGERGLLGLVLDNDFSSNGYLYVYYTTTEPRNRVSRFTVVGNLASPASEFVVWENPDPVGGFHQGGCVGIDSNDRLFLSTGDQFVSANAQDLGNQHGKILRLNLDGSVPADNPFVSVPGADPAIWALGVRNPFRFHLDPASDDLWLGSVGSNGVYAWEEMNYVEAGRNYGWPDQEGNDCYVPDCSPYEMPLFTYQHTDPVYNNGQSQGSILAGPVYRDVRFPVAYHGNLFYADYANQWIRRLVLHEHDSGAPDVHGDVLFATPAGGGSISDLKLGPDGHLYSLTFGSDWGGGSSEAAVYRIEYVGFGNLPPVALASASVTSGPEPLPVTFDGTASYDPDLSGPLTYFWAFGDGGTSTAAVPTHVYTAAGVYRARLTVSDGTDQSVAAPLTIAAGNAPVPVITQPAPGTTYQAGDVIAYSGGASDVEDGTLAPAALTWDVILIHDQHTHPYQTETGVASGSVTIPTTGHSPEDTYYEVQLTALDADGLTTTVAVPLDPEVVGLSLDTRPPGIPLFLDGNGRPTPFRYQSLARFEHQVSAQPYYFLNGRHHLFRDWNDGGAATHTVVVPDSGRRRLLLRARYDEAIAVPVVSSVAADVRNAQYHAINDEELGDIGDPLRLRCGRDVISESQWGFQFALDVPRGAYVQSAVLEVVAADDQAPEAEGVVWAYDVGDAPPFDAAHNHLLTQHAPLTSASAYWVMQTFVNGQVYPSPDLAALVQEVVDRPDWSPGQHLGLVVDGSVSLVGDHRTVRSFAAGQPAVLRVTYLRRERVLKLR